MKPIKGISRDNKPVDQPDGTYIFGRNGVQASVLGAVINERGMATLAELELNPIGIIQVDSEFVIFSTDNTRSQVGVLDDEGGYTPMWDDNDFSFRLGFNLDAPVTGRAKRNYAGEIIVIFRDDNHRPRYGNLSLPPESESDLLLFAEADIPDLTVTIQNRGGAMTTGAHFIYLQYEDIEGAKSKWIGEYKPIFVGDDSGFGSKGGVRSSASIGITMIGTDQDYDYINIALVSSEGGVLKARKIKRILNSSGTVNTTITGTETTTDLTLEELTIPTPTYIDIKHFADVNGELFGGNVKADERLNFQPIANGIQLRWRSVLRSITNAIPDKANSFRSLHHQEVYAVYIGVVRTDTNVEEIFHIPGRLSSFDARVDLKSGLSANGVDATMTIKQVAISRGMTESEINNKDIFFRWDDIQIDPNIQVFHTQDTGAMTEAPVVGDPVQTAAGRLGFWENADEFYPTDVSVWGALAGQKVKHHRMPSLGFMGEIVYASRPGYGIVELDTLGIEIVPGTLNIPPDMLDKIQGYRLYIAKRNINNSTVLGQAPTIMTGRYDPHDGSVTDIVADFAVPGNYSLPEDGGDGSGNIWIDPLVVPTAGSLGIKLHALDILLNKPQVSPAYLASQYKLRRFTNDDHATSFDAIDPRIPGGATTYGNSVLMRENRTDEKSFNIPANYTTMGNVVRTTMFTGRKYQILSLDPGFTQYVPQGINGANVWNDTSEEALYVKPRRATPAPFLEFSDVLFTEEAGQLQFRYPMFEDILIVNIMNYQKNVYSSMFDQETICISQTFSPDENGSSNDGDIWVSLQSFTTMGAHRTPKQFENPSQGLRAYHSWLGESVVNPLMRWEDPALPGSLFYPKSPEDYAYKIYRTDPVQYAYSKDYSQVNSLTQRVIFDDTRRVLSDFPYRVIRFGRSKSEEREDSWRRQLALDYFESVKNRGEITNLESMAGNLIIHYRDGLRVTESKYRITNDEGSITAALGTGDIFELEPRELVPSPGGYAGLQHKFGALLTPAGYFFIDCKHGRPYLLAGDSLKPVAQGLQNLLRDLFRDNPIMDNPYQLLGFALGYDLDNNRLLITVHYREAVSKVFREYTISYSLDTEMYTFFHDYFPTAYLSGRSKMFSIREKTIFQHGINNPGVFEQPLQIKPFSIDVVIPIGAQSAVLESISWFTEVSDLLGTIYENQTFTHITVWTGNMCTGKIALKNYDPLNYDYNQTTRDRRGAWHFNELRDLVGKANTRFIGDLTTMFEVDQNAINEDLPWFEQRFLEGNYFIIRFEYDNLDGKLISLHDVDVDATESQM